MLNLPTKPVKAELKNPETLIIYGLPKIGKTTTVAALKDCLVVNFEDKKQTADGMIYYMDDISKPSLDDFVKTIKELNRPYKYIALDTVTKLEELAIAEAEKIYASTPVGKGWFIKTEEGKILPGPGKKKYKEILFLPNGAGYQYLTKALMKVINVFKSCADTIIFIAHVKDKNLNKDGAEFTSADLNLMGKNKGILSQMTHAIAYMHRRGKKNYLEFIPSDDVLAGCKVKRLEGKEFLISEYDENNNLVTYWSDIFITK